MANRPYDIPFNAMVMTMANRCLPKGWDVSDDAPNTYEDLVAHIEVYGRVAVWSGDSDDTVFGDREHNWAFRAWHDYCHYLGKFDFSLEGERKTAYMQVNMMFNAYGVNHTTTQWASWILCEVVGQAMYVQEHNDFPKPQIDFFLADKLSWYPRAHTLAKEFLAQRRAA